IPIEAHEQVVQNDLLGYLRGTHAVLPIFKRQRAGTLINNISLGGFAPQPYAASYSAAKFGLRGFAESLRGELHDWPDIHVCNLYPSVMDTPGFRDGGNYTGRSVKPVPPVYDPRRTARAIVDVARRPRHSTYVGVPALLSLLAQVTPGYSPFNACLVRTALDRARPQATSSGNLFAPPSGERRIDGGFRDPAAKRRTTIAATTAIAALVGLGVYRYRRNRREP
ncbi:MAG: SDR family NAD(P)-dependent oxidoreductase, partial [Halomonas sp.]|nr:SDR family NAD(P)-dependent oxidoreductase [Halomonas sp.]